MSVLDPPFEEWPVLVRELSMPNTLRKATAAGYKFDTWPGKQKKGLGPLWVNLTCVDSKANQPAAICGEARPLIFNPS